MKNNEVKTKIDQLITNEVGHSDWEHNEDFARGIRLDSIEIMSLIVEVEDAFNLKSISEDKLEGITTPEKLIDFVQGIEDLPAPVN